MDANGELWSLKEYAESEKFKEKLEQYKATRERTAEIIDDFLAGKVLYVPDDLIAHVENNVEGRIERKEGILCLWSIIHAGFYESKDGWKYVHSDNFYPIWGDSRAGEMKQYLIPDFLEEDGISIPGSKSMGYKTKYRGTIVPYKIKSPSKRLTKILATPKKNTDNTFKNSPVLQYQHKMLKKLAVDKDEARYIALNLISLWTNAIDARSDAGTLLEQFASEEPVTSRQKEILAAHENKKKERLINLSKRTAEAITRNTEKGNYSPEEIGKINNNKLRELVEGWNEISRSPMSDNELLSTFALPIFKIAHKKGLLSLGHLSGRVFTPLTGLHRDFREAIYWTGKNLSGRWKLLDMRCCQPTIIAYDTQDHLMIDDCKQDKYYDNIKERLGITRDEAKVAFCEYAYGNNRTKRSKNKQALAVQEMMEELYPTAHSVIWRGKTGDHRQYIRHLQQRESSIFIQKIYPRVMKENLHALTIHDGLFTAEEDGQRVEEIMRDVLDTEPVPIEQKIKVDSGGLCLQPGRKEYRERGNLHANSILHLFMERLPGELQNYTAARIKHNIFKDSLPNS